MDKYGNMTRKRALHLGRKVGVIRRFDVTGKVGKSCALRLKRLDPTTDLIQRGMSCHGEDAMSTG